MATGPAELEEALARLRADNRSLRDAIALLHRIANLVRKSLEVEPTAYAVLTGVTAGVGLGLNRAMIFAVDDDRRWLRGVAGVGPSSRQEADRVWRSIEREDPDLETLYAAGLERRGRPSALDRRVRAATIDVEGRSPVALAMRRGDLVIGEGDDDASGLLHPPTAIAAPFEGGVLYADNRFTAEPLSEAGALVLSLVADHAGRALDNARQFERIAAEARTDALTGLGHHGALMDALGAACASAAEERAPLGLMMLDLDDFKGVNDTHGHPAGDALLAGVASRIGGVVRRDARAFRYGGDEFAVLLPGADRASARRVGERIRDALAGRPLPLGLSVTHAITCSVGVASMPEDAADSQALLAAADAALLSAKRQGKNRVG